MSHRLYYLRNILLNRSVIHEIVLKLHVNIWSRVSVCKARTEHQISLLICQVLRSAFSMVTVTCRCQTVKHSLLPRSLLVFHFLSSSCLLPSSLHPFYEVYNIMMSSLSREGSGHRSSLAASSIFFSPSFPFFHNSFYLFIPNIPLFWSLSLLHSPYHVPPSHSLILQ